MVFFSQYFLHKHTALCPFAFYSKLQTHTYREAPGTACVLSARGAGTKEKRVRAWKVAYFRKQGSVAGIEFNKSFQFQWWGGWTRQGSWKPGGMRGKKTSRAEGGSDCRYVRVEGPAQCEAVLVKRGRSDWGPARETLTQLAAEFRERSRDQRRPWWK